MVRGNLCIIGTFIKVDDNLIARVSPTINGSEINQIRCRQTYKIGRKSPQLVVLSQFVYACDLPDVDTSVDAARLGARATLAPPDTRRRGKFFADGRTNRSLSHAHPTTRSESRSALLLRRLAFLIPAYTFEMDSRARHNSSSEAPCHERPCRWRRGIRRASSREDTHYDAGPSNRF